MSFSVLDIIIILLILMFAIEGFKNGIIKEGVSFVGTVAIFIISYSFKGMVGNELCKFLPFLNFSGSLKGLVSLNILIYQLVGFFLIFIILYGLFHIIVFASKLLQKVIDFTIILTIPSKIAGLVIGLVKGYLIVFILLLVLIIPLGNNDLFKGSFLMDKILYNTPFISKQTNDITKSVTDTSDLIKKINKKKISTNEANLELINSMLNYKVIDKHTLEQIIVLDKLKDVDGVENLVK